MRPTSIAPRVFGPNLRERRRPGDVAGDAAQEDQRASGISQSLCRTCTGATPGLAEPQRVSPEAVGVLGRPLSCDAGDVVLAA